MENTSYALIVAASTLIAVVIIAVAAFVFNNLGIFQQSQEDLVKRENITEFNKSFEAYNKSLMYGTDVLSCLNLAENNNQKYVYEVYQGDDNSTISYTARDQLIVDVEVIIGKTIQESISVSASNENGSVIQLTADECNPDGSGRGQGYPVSSYENSKTSLFSTGSDGLFTTPIITCYYFKNNEGNHGSNVLSENFNYYNTIIGSNSDNKLITKTIDTKIEAGQYNLVADSKLEIDDTAKLMALLATATESEQTVYNNNYLSEYGYGSIGGRAWLSATWKTAVSDFKTRKFRCTKLEYNAETGYVNYLEFEEID